MERVNVAEARKQFSELVARVAYTGERVIIERRGKPMMALVSMEDLERLEGFVVEQDSIRQRRLTALRLATASRKRIAQERQGVPLLNSADLLHQLREERDDELAGLR